MARIKAKFKGGLQSKTFSEQVTRRVLEHYTSPNELPLAHPKNRGLIDRIFANLNTTFPALADEAIGSQFAQGLDEVKENLAIGISTQSPKRVLSEGPASDGFNVRWPPLSEAYHKRKARQFPTYQDRFWRRRTTRGLAGKFSSFAAAYKRRLGKQASRLTLLRRGTKFVSRNTLFQIAYEYTVPAPPSGGEFMDSLFRQAFLLRNTRGLVPDNPYDRSNPLSELYFNEMGTRRAPPRPFVQRIMTRRGRATAELLDKLASRL